MDFALDDDQSLMVATVRRWSASQLAGWAADADRRGQAPPQLWRSAGELGLLIDAVPETDGGMLDGDYSHLLRALRNIELGRACGGLAALVDSNVEAALAVIRSGSEDARQSLFAALTHELEPRIAITVHDFYERLELVVGAGGVITVRGRLGPLPGLAVASHILLIRPEDDGVIVALVDVPSGAASPCTPSGWRAAAWASWDIDVSVPAERVLARGPAGRELAAAILAGYRAALAARALGAASSAIEHAAAYAEERIQFGQPIGTFQSLALLRDENQTAISAARLLVLEAAWSIDHQTPDCADKASRARDLACRVLSRAAIDAVQIYGGYGFVNDFPVEKIMRDARVFEVLGGNEALARILDQTGSH